MRIIPVIDYKQGQVVLAVKGQRDTYRPITEGLFEKPNLSCAIETFIKLTDCIYIADLDSITEKKMDHALWSDLLKRYPNTQFWLDLGSEVEQWSTFMHRASNVRPIVASEAFTSSRELCTILQKLAAFRPLLSIDMYGDSILGPTDIITSLASWPKDLICLQLKRVGTAAGPDINWLKNNITALKNFNLYIGGGIRNAADIELLEKENVSGVLIANSLHNGAISLPQIKSSL